MRYYATLGGSCKDTAVIGGVLRAGVDCFRLNLSHGSLREKADWIDALRRAERETGRAAGLMIDLRGPEIRTGRNAPDRLLDAGETVEAASLGLLPEVYDALAPGQELRIDDGGAVLVLERGGVCRAVRAGRIAPRKSVALPGLAPELPMLTAEDAADLADGPGFGVTAVMQPFVRSREALDTVRQAMERAGLGQALLYAKIEDETGLESLPRWIDGCDVVTAARGDLGANLGLEHVPAAQKRVAEVCRRAGKPLLVVTELLGSMAERPVPSRAEVSDICNAVWDGAEHLMLTNETAAGRYPVEAAEWLVRCGEEAGRVSPSVTAEP